MLVIVIDTDNAAFEDNPEQLNQILSTLARRSTGCPDDLIGESVRDINGNTVCRVYGQIAGVPKP
jgi:predicted Ser/Thr protein kinase